MSTKKTTTKTGKSKTISSKKVVSKSKLHVTEPNTEKSYTDGKVESNDISIQNGIDFRLIEKRKHPRFLLTHEQFRETKSGKIYTVFDLSLNGLAIKVEDRPWKEGSIIQGILNLNPESIEITPRLLGYYGDRAALKLEALSTYSKGVLSKALSPKRLGSSLKLIREKLPLADFWFHGVCNTDLLIRLGEAGEINKIDLFFANFYYGWMQKNATTGICHSFGPDKREPAFLADEPVQMESIEIDHDRSVDQQKLEWALQILEASGIDSKLKNKIINQIKTN